MSDHPCGRCGVDLPPGSRFCTQCGAPTSSRSRGRTPPSGVPAVDAEDAARLVECGECGASNAASRPLCARCGTPLRDEVPGGDALPEPEPAVSAPALGGPRSDTSPVVLGLFILAGLVIAGVLLSQVATRLTGGAAPAVPTGVRLSQALASSALGDHAAALAVDGDPTTAWIEAAPGGGVGEYIEVTLSAPEEVRRILVWNGDQASAEDFAERGRATSVRIEVADRQFRVALLDILGPQAVDLPGGLITDRVRLVVEEVVDGDSAADLAVSEIVVEAAPR